MHTNIDQRTVDEKIHRFMARKSPWRAASRLIAEKLLPVGRRDITRDIGYEPLVWRNDHK